MSTNRTLAQAFAADSMANPNDAFDLRQRRNQLTADDGKRAIQIIRDSMASAAKESDIVGEYSDPDKMRNYILMGKPMPKDGIMEPVKQPPELAVTVGRFRNKLAEVMPWVDMRQALWAFDVVNGRGEGDDNMDVNAAYSKNPLLPAVAAANATLSADSSRK